MTKELMKSWGKELHLVGGRNIFLFVLWCVLGVLSAGGLVLSVAIDMDWLYPYLYAMCLVISLYKLLLERIVLSARRYKLLSSMYGGSEWMRTVEFLEDELVITDHSAVQKYPYAAITGIKENGDRILIVLKNRLGVRIYRNTFTIGTWEQCREMLRAKTGK